MNKKEPDDELDGTPPSAEQEEEDLGGHPLFPRPETETGPDPRRFDIIQVHRWYGPKNEFYERCPREFKGSELRTWEQIVEMFGGQCTYKLTAKCSKTHRYQAQSEKWYFDGPARKPFFEEPRRGPSSQPDPNAPHGQGPWGQPPGAPTWGPHAGAYPGYPPPYYPPSPPTPQQQPMDVLGFMQVMFDRDAKARAAEAQARAQVEVAQLQYQQSLLKLAIDRPNVLEQAREILEFTKSVQPPTRRDDAPTWREAYEAIKEAKTEGGGEKSDEWSLAAAAPIVTAVLNFMNTKRAEPQAPQPPAPPQPAPTPEPAPQPPVFDPATGAVYVFVPGIGHCKVVDPATMQAAQQQPVTPPFAPPAPQQPVVQPAPPFAPPAPQQPVVQQARPVASYTPQQPVAQPAPPFTYPQPQPVVQPAPPVAYSPPQPSVQPSPPIVAPVKGSSAMAPPMSDAHRPPPVGAQIPSPQLVPRGLRPWGRVGETPDDGSSGQHTAPDDPSQLFSSALTSITNGLPPDFEQTVKEAMSSPIAQSITSHPKFKSIHDAASKGELTPEEAQEQALTFLKRAVGGDS